MKKIFSALFLFAPVIVGAQNKLTGPNVKLVPSITTDIEKVARDYNDHFENIRGEQISETENIVEYASKINPLEALESSIIQIKSLENSYSWQTVMLYTENFNEAAAKYKQLYRQLTGGKFSMKNGKSYKLSGLYDTPEQSRTFASTLLSLGTEETQLKDFKVELALNYSIPEWIVKIYVYEKEDDEDMRPTVNNDY